MIVRLFTLVGELRASPKVIHYQGLPLELSHEDRRNEYPLPRVIVLEGEEGSFMLNRFTNKKEPVGDTWHQTIDDAKHQAEYEYGDALGEWKQVPTGIVDAVEYALTTAS